MSACSVKIRRHINVFKITWLQHYNAAGSFCQSSEGHKTKEASVIFTTLFTDRFHDFISRQNIQIKVGFV